LFGAVQAMITLTPEVVTVGISTLPGLSIATMVVSADMVPKP
jgi:hypothetical protein